MVIVGRFPARARKPVGLFKRNAIRIFVLFAAAMSLAGCEAITGTPNIYKMPVARAYHKLMNVAIAPSGKGPFGRLDIATAGDRNKVVEWTVKGRPEPLCTASLKPADGEQTRVDVSCKAVGDGAGAGITANLIRNRVIELVDATLKDRAFDPKRADEGATAANWPKDVIDHGTIGTAAAQALEMERKMAQDMQQMRSSARR